MQKTSAWLDLVWKKASLSFKYPWHFKMVMKIWFLFIHLVWKCFWDKIGPCCKRGEFLVVWHKTTWYSVVKHNDNDQLYEQKYTVVFNHCICTTIQFRLLNILLTTNYLFRQKYSTKLGIITNCLPYSKSFIFHNSTTPQESTC